MECISISGLYLAFRDVPVFEDLSAGFEEGVIHVIQGPNGSGKSVLFKLMCGFLKPDRGSVHLARKYASDDGRFPESVGVLIDRPGYLPSRTGIDNLRSLAAIRRKVGDRDIVDAMMRVGLDPNLRQPVKHYSLGMKQKLGVAQAFMEHQQVLLLDEPFNGLDPESVDRVGALLREFRDEGRTVVFTSHDLGDPDTFADRSWRVSDLALKPVERDGSEK